MGAEYHNFVLLKSLLPHAVPVDSIYWLQVQCRFWHAVQYMHNVFGDSEKKSADPTVPFQMLHTLQTQRSDQTKKLCTTMPFTHSVSCHVVVH